VNPQVPGYLGNLGTCPERSLHPGSTAIHDFVEEDSTPIDRPNAPKLDTRKPGAVQVIAFELGFYTREQLLKTRGPDAIKAEELRKTIGECLDFKQELSQL
jgi:hypothetical protein